MKSLRKVPFFNKLGILTGGLGMYLATFGCWVLLIASIGTAYNSKLILIGHTWGDSEGILSKIEREAVEKGRKKKLAFHYEYTLTYEIAGEEYINTCYKYFDEEENSYEEGQRVAIEYCEKMPQYARIAGTDAVPHATWVAIFPLVLLIGFFAGWIAVLLKNVKSISLLKSGALTRGVLDRKEAHPNDKEDKPTYTYYFTFSVNGKSYTVKAISHKEELLEDEPTEKILYDPSNPDRAFVYDSLPHLPSMDEEGNLSRKSYFFSILGYILLNLVGLFVLFCTMILVQ
jgi:hypothetical protein